eukprot:10923553-Ditylum_brightwellii.AAC.1
MGRFTGLQMRIYQHKHNSYSINQTRYTSNVINKYNHSSCPWVPPNHRSTPVPPDHIYPKTSRSSSKEEDEAISTRFLDLMF